MYIIDCVQLELYNNFRSTKLQKYANKKRVEYYWSIGLPIHRKAL
jgi:hypothetical protein